MKTWNQLQQKSYVNMNLFMDFYNKEALPFNASSGQDLVRKTVLFLVDDYYNHLAEKFTEMELVRSINATVIDLYSKFDSARDEEEFCEYLYGERDMFFTELEKNQKAKRSCIATVTLKDVKHLFEIEELS